MSDDQTDYFDRLVDLDALEAFLAAHLGSADVFEVDRHPGGHSNETLFVTWDDRNLVVRRPPPGETADTAHDVIRKYTVLEALQATHVPVPTTVVATEDHDIIGSDFYVMEKREGVVIRDDEPDQFATPTDRTRLGTEMIDTLAAIHTVDYETVGLEEFGRPDGFTQRQVDRWEQQYEWAFEVTAEAREIPAVHELTEWLQANVPSDHPHTLVHGDYKLDNVMFGPAGERNASSNERSSDAREQPPELEAVLDWEMSTIGDPFTDLGWLLSYWPDEDDATTKVGTAGDAEYLLREGYHSRAELVERYEQATGYRFENDRFYRALAYYKLGGIGEMFFRRHLEGNADDDHYPIMEERVPEMARRALQIIDGEG
ncbi:Predicted kinase, aminoglycoside phosphotransferase (APT) family [Natronorubrum sediminis]|uniref:Predicted kinase, aminoglycoside phosphotransferase (APT) family n=1 Tax=Natronorubrum sediminis TaxID=640943 RepID=A0A1H6G2G9_9EURY|nr:phosphotransferase family protein [Natronorubrum sediminis]SEH17249.1 Predicted kinase, aminoglycoside phosphotransferase (APT) family [Natronorubrum sediminis]